MDRKKGDEELLTVIEVARILRVSRNYAYELVRRGVLPAFRLGRHIRVRRQSVDRLVDDASTARVSVERAD